MKCLLEISGDGLSVGKGQAAVEEDIFVTDGDDVIVEHAGIDEVWILKRVISRSRWCRRATAWEASRN